MEPLSPVVIERITKIFDATIERIQFTQEEVDAILGQSTQNGVRSTTKETLKRIEMLLRIVGYLKATCYYADLPPHIDQTQAVRDYFRNPHPHVGGQKPIDMLVFIPQFSLPYILSKVTVKDPEIEGRFPQIYLEWEEKVGQ